MSRKSNPSKRSRKAAKEKPAKPFAKFPLGPANNGRWQKRIGGKLHYFGRWGRVVNGKMTRIQDDGCWAEALALYEAQIEDILQGRKPRARLVNGAVSKNDAKPEGLTVADLCNEFLT